MRNRFRGGDTVQNAVGVLGYDFSLYRIFPTGPADYTAVNPRPAAPEPVGGNRPRCGDEHAQLLRHRRLPDRDVLDNKCGPLNNVECRGWDSDQADRIHPPARQTPHALSGLDADIIGLNELENTTGVEPLASIVSGMPGYDYINTGTIGTDAIKVGLIYRPAVVTPVGDFQTPRLGGRPALHRHQEPPVAGADLRGQRHRRSLHRGRQPPQIQGLRLQ